MPLRLDQFHFFDPFSGVRRTRRDLPHWDQPEVCAFLTFRTGDSLPVPLLNQWRDERDAWLRDKGLDPFSKSWRADIEELPPPLPEQFHRAFTARIHDFLDAGHGECPLRRPSLREIVTSALHHWDGERCLLAGYVIMPNHVHILTQPLPGHTLSGLCHSWKTWTAKRINESLGRAGSFWQGESWDHLLRGYGYLRKYRKYFRRNPVKAGLSESEYTLYLPEITGLPEDP